jgi:hypothetical protein
LFGQAEIKPPPETCHVGRHCSLAFVNGASSSSRSPADEEAFSFEARRLIDPSEHPGDQRPVQEITGLTQAAFKKALTMLVR